MFIELVSIEKNANHGKILSCDTIYDVAFSLEILHVSEVNFLEI